MDPAGWPDDHRAGRSQRAGGERAGVVRHRQHRRGRASRRRLVAHSRAHAFQGHEDADRANAIAQKIQDVGGYINAYTSFDRTVFWIDVPKDGVATALDILSDAMMNSTLPPEEYKKEQEVIRREFAMGLDDPDRMAGLLLFATAYQRHPYRLPVIGEMEIYNQLTQEQVMQYYKSRYVPNNLTFIVVGDVDAEKIHQQLADFFKDLSGEIAQAGFHSGGTAATRPARGAPGIRDGAERGFRSPGIFRSSPIPTCRRSICSPRFSATDAARVCIGGCARKPVSPSASRHFPTRRAIPVCSASMRRSIQRIAKRPSN